MKKKRIIMKKKCSRDLDGLLPKSYCERRICIVIWPREAEDFIAIQLFYCRQEKA